MFIKLLRHLPKLTVDCLVNVDNIVWINIDGPLLYLRMIDGSEIIADADATVEGLLGVEAGSSTKGA